MFADDSLQSVFYVCLLIHFDLFHGHCSIAFCIYTLYKADTSKLDARVISSLICLRFRLRHLVIIFFPRDHFFFFSFPAIFCANIISQSQKRKEKKGEMKTLVDTTSATGATASAWSSPALRSRQRAVCLASLVSGREKTRED